MKARHPTILLVLFLVLPAPLFAQQDYDHPAVQHYLSHEWTADISQYGQGPAGALQGQIRIEFVGDREMRVHMGSLRTRAGSGGMGMNLRKMMNPIHNRITEVRALSDTTFFLAARPSKEWQRKIVEQMLNQMRGAISGRALQAYRQKMMKQIAQSSPTPSYQLIKLAGDSALALGVIRRDQQKLPRSVRAMSWSEARRSPHWTRPVVFRTSETFTHGGGGGEGTPGGPGEPGEPTEPEEPGEPEEPEEPGEPEGPGRGAAHITIQTTAPREGLVDPDGYRLNYSSAANSSFSGRVEMGVNDSHQLSGVPEGMLYLELEGLATGCSLPDTARTQQWVRSVGDPARITLNVACNGVTLTANVRHAGAEAPPEGYLEVGDGSAFKQLVYDDPITFEGLVPGTHQLRFAGLPDRCLPARGDSVVNLDLDRESISRTFAIHCLGATASLSDTVAADQPLKEPLTVQGHPEGTTTWSLVDGDLPHGIKLASTGQQAFLTGPPDVGEYDFTLQVTDDEGRTARLQDSLVVWPRLTLTAETTEPFRGTVIRGENERDLGVGEGLFLPPDDTATVELETTDFSYYLRRADITGPALGVSLEKSRALWSTGESPRGEVDVDMASSREVSVELRRCPKWKAMGEGSNDVIWNVWPGTFEPHDCNHPSDNTLYHPVGGNVGPSPYLAVLGDGYRPTLQVYKPDEEILTEHATTMGQDWNWGHSESVGFDLTRADEHPVLILGTSEMAGGNSYRAVWTRCGGPMRPGGVTEITISEETSCSTGYPKVRLDKVNLVQSRFFSLDESWGSPGDDLSIKGKSPGSGLYGKGVLSKACLYKVKPRELTEIECDRSIGLDMTIDADIENVTGLYMLVIGAGHGPGLGYGETFPVDVVVSLERDEF